MEEKHIEDRQLAFLVDGDNASATLIEEMLDEASKYGSVIIRRVYGNWTSGGQVGTWKSALKEYALTPQQQFPNISNRHITKNATDIALIIDAMDILHDGIVKGFVIVSSDSDYTSLAIKIREHGLFVIGIGKKDTHDSFRRACDVFVSTENLSEHHDDGLINDHARNEPIEPRKRKNAIDALDVLNKAFDYAVNDDGRALNGDIGAALRRQDPSFDTRTYGKSSLLDLIDELDSSFIVERSNNGAIYVRRRGEATAEPEKVPKEIAEKQAHKTPIDALPILTQAYNETGKDRDGNVDTYRLFKTARRIDPNFDSSIYGKEKISKLLETLPESFILIRKGKNMLTRMVNEKIVVEPPLPVQKPSVEEELEEIIPSPPVSNDVSTIQQARRSQIDVLNSIIAAYKNVAKEDGLAFLPQMGKELKRMEPNLDFKEFGKSGLREMIEEFSDIFNIIKKGKNVYVVKKGSI